MIVGHPRLHLTRMTHDHEMDAGYAPNVLFALSVLSVTARQPHR